MKITSANAMPMATCPHCESVVQFDDWYDFRGGESRECPNCEKTIHVLDVERVMYVRLGTEPERPNVPMSGGPLADRPARLDGSAAHGGIDEQG